VTDGLGVLFGVGVPPGADGDVLTDGEGVVCRRGVAVEGAGVAVLARGVALRDRDGDGDRDGCTTEGEVVGVGDPCGPPEAGGQ